MSTLEMVPMDETRRIDPPESSHHSDDSLRPPTAAAAAATAATVDRNHPSDLCLPCGTLIDCKNTLYTYSMLTGAVGPASGEHSMARRDKARSQSLDSLEEFQAALHSSPTLFHDDEYQSLLSTLTPDTRPEHDSLGPSSLFKSMLSNGWRGLLSLSDATADKHASEGISSNERVAEQEVPMIEAHMVVSGNGRGSAMDLPTLQALEAMVVSSFRFSNCRLVLCRGASVLFIVALASVALSACFDGACLTDESSATMRHHALIAKFIQNISLGGHIGNPESNGTVSTTAEQMALHWLVQHTPLALTPNSPASRFILTQRYAIATLVTQGNKGMLWYGNKHECDWNGVVCQPVHLGEETVQAVTNFSMAISSRLGVYVAADFGLLSHLVHLNLSQCKLAGSLPSTIGLWTTLQTFDMSQHGYPTLRGSLPTSVQEWRHLEHFDISGAALTGSFLSLGQWKKLTHFDASNTKLNGTLPSDLGKLTDLVHFNVRSTEIHGTLPLSIGRWTLLKSFSVGGGSLGSINGTLPSSMCNWTKLQHFEVGSALLTGKIPDFVGGWTDLAKFQLSMTKLSGTLPSSIGQWSNLLQFLVNGNELSGSIPLCVGNWTNLNTFSCGKNSFTGNLPSSIGQWTKLEMFYAGDNNLVGSLPSNIGLWNNIQSISVKNNSLSGQIPTSMSHWKHLQLGEFSINNLTGSVPIGICSSSALLLLEVDCGEVSCECINTEVCSCH